MILGFILLWAFLHLVLTQAQNCTPSKENLQDEYYTVAITCTNTFQPSDDTDAETILGNNASDEDVASVLPYRGKIRRNAISKRISAHIQSIIDVIGNGYAADGMRSIWIDESYRPQCNRHFTDFVYSLIFDENVVLAGYLRNFFENKSEKWINIAMVLTKDMWAMINAYGADDFKRARKGQRKTFEHMLRVWVKLTREPLENDDPLPEAIQKDVEDLKKEQDKGGWHEDRYEIEQITMKKSIKHARLVIAQLEKLNDCQALEDILTENVKKCGMDESLADTYASLVRYIKNKYDYIARILAENCDSSSQWAGWMMCIAVVHPQEWPMIDEAFKKNQKGISLSKFIREKITDEDDKILAEAMAVVVDSTFKPTLFIKRPIGT